MTLEEFDAALAALGWKVSEFCRATGLHRNTPSMWRNQGAAIPAWVPQHLGLLLDVKRLHAAHAVPSSAKGLCCTKPAQDGIPLTPDAAMQ